MADILIRRTRAETGRISRDSREVIEVRSMGEGEGEVGTT